jgi:tetratricopeptide (TPR) repeat protein
MSSKNLYLITGLIILFSACQSSKKIFERAFQYGANGEYCKATDELAELRLKTKEEPAKINALVSAVNDYAPRCIAVTMNEARDIKSKAKSLTELRQAYDRCLGAKQKGEEYEKVFKAKVPQADFRIWQSADEAFRLELYENITETIYKESIQAYQTGKLEEALTGFEAVEERQKEYKETINYIQTIREQLAEKNYQAGLHQLAVGSKFQLAYDYFVASLKWVPRYKDADSLLAVSYEKVTEELYNEALNAKDQKKYRSAWQIYQKILTRNGALDKHPQLREEAQECVNLGKKVFFLNADDQEVNTNLNRHISTQIQDPFFEITRNPFQAQYRLDVNIRYNTETPNPTRNRKNAYLIKSYEIDQRKDSATIVKVRKFYAEDMVNYFEVIKTKTVTCIVNYTLKSLQNNTQTSSPTPPTLSNKAEDKLQYNELPNGISLADLFNNQIKRNPDSNPTTRPTAPTNWTELFQQRQVFKTDDEMRKTAKSLITNNLNQAIQKELEEAIKKIE